jgi:hypothetical protein
MSAFTVGTLGDLSRRPVCAALESGIAETTTAAFGDLLALSRLGQIADQLTGIDIVHDRATGNHYVQVLAGAPGLVAPRTTLAAVSPKFSGDSKVGKCVQGWLRHQIDTATMTAVTTIGAAALHEFLTTKTQATVAAVARLHPDCGFVDEFHIWILFAKQKTPLVAGLLDS